MHLIPFLALGFAIAWLLSVVYVAWQLTHPPRRGSTWALARNLPASPAELSPPLPFDTWRFRSSHSRGTFEVWSIPGHDPAGPTILFSHGWGDSRINSLPRLAGLLPAASRVIMWDLAAHADTPIDRTDPPPSHLSMGVHEVDDLCDLIDHLTAPSPHAPTSPADRLILAGFSLGAGLSIAAAARPQYHTKVLAVIAEAPYVLPQTPARNVMHIGGFPHRLNLIPALWLVGLLTRTGPRWLSRAGSFDRATLAAKLTCPLLVIHSADDEICPFADAEAIVAAARNARLLQVQGLPHTQLWPSPESPRVTDEITTFTRSCAPEPAAVQQH